MKTMRSTKRVRRSASRRWEVKKGDAFNDAAALLSKATCHVFKGAPSQIIGTAERRTKRILGLKATYGPGETVTLRFRKDGSYSVAFGLRMTTKVRAK
jgi:hypothetical protein